MLPEKQAKAFNEFYKATRYNETEQFVMDRLPNAQKIELANSGHYPWLEDTKNFRKVLSQFYEMEII